MFLDGEGSISCEGETVQFQKGDTVFLPAGSGSYMIEGKCDALVTTIREKTGLADIKVELGRENAKIVIEDSSKKQVTSKVLNGMNLKVKHLELFVKHLLKLTLKNKK